jgi:hypothetical protein
MTAAASRAAVLLLAGALAGCSGARPVQPWEKRALALPEMRIGGSATDGGLERHVYSNREAASGGDRAGAGGCGCR